MPWMPSENAYAKMQIGINAFHLVTFPCDKKHAEDLKS